MSVPGREHELQGWDAFVHVLRHYWWLIPVALLAAAGSAALALLEPDPVVGDCHMTPFMERPPACDVEEPPWGYDIGASVLQGAAFGPTLLLFFMWLFLRIGAVQEVACPSCNEPHRPARGCGALHVTSKHVDRAVFRARAALAWTSMLYRPVLWLGTIFVLAILLVVVGVMVRGDTAWSCETDGIVKTCQHAYTGPGWADAVVLPSAVLAIGVPIAAQVWWLFRLVRPIPPRVADPHAPPGGW